MTRQEVRDTLKFLKTQLIPALRSGNYRKGTGFLRSRRRSNNYEYCCLGVACNITNPSAWSTDTDIGHGRYSWRGNSSSDVKELAYNEEFPLRHLTEKELCSLAALNDFGSEDWSSEDLTPWVKDLMFKKKEEGINFSTFDEVADAIEKYIIPRLTKLAR